MSVLTRKIQIIPVGDKEEINRVYTYIRDGMKAQNLAMNQYISALYMAEMQEISKEDRKELNHLYGRISSSKKGSAYDVHDIQFPVGLPTASSLTMKVKQDFSKSMKQGLKYGRVSLPNYKIDNPLLIHVDYVRLRSSNPHKDFGIYHNYENHNELMDALKNGNPEIFIKFANDITFKFVFGNPYKSAFIREEFIQIFEENYTVNGSSIQFDKNNKKIILNLSMTVPDKEITLDENTVVGVDLGLNIPAVCGLNNDNYERSFIGSRDDFLRVRTKIQAQRKRLSSGLKNTNGGHGRKKKLQALSRYEAYERNFAKTYNHMISKRVIDFALKNNAKYINIEDLSGFNSSEFVLRNWSFYELQQMITYKAKTYGIEVRKINPYHTSQNCSFCGTWNENNRESQKAFICKNPECKNYMKEINADWNASRNIAKSIDFV